MARTGAKIDFSRLFVYYNARGIANYYYAKWAEEEAANKTGQENEKEEEEEEEEQEDYETITDNGSSIMFAIVAMQQMGICEEGTWDFDIRTGKKVMNVNTKPSPEAYEEAEDLMESPRFQWEMPEKLTIDLFAMKHCLAEGFPFVFGLVLFEKFDVALARGYVPMPDLESEKGRESHGRHAMLCVGYKDSAKVFIVRNSWGPLWGDEGYCYIPYEYMTNPELCSEAYKIKGHFFGKDLSDGVWCEDDGDFGEEFYKLPEEKDETCIFSLEEAICVVSFLGASVDGVSEEEQDLLFSLFEEYHIESNMLQRKIAYLSNLGEGLETCRDAAVKIILAYNQATLAFLISARFAFADGKLTREEQIYWNGLAKDLGIEEEAVYIFEELFEENPETEQDWKILSKPIRWLSRGESVTRLQEELKRRGYGVKVNSIVRLGTRSAIMKFQTEQGLQADGVVKQDTWDALFVE